MTRTDIMLLVAALAFLLALFCLTRFLYWRDFLSGRRAFRDGLRYNPQWGKGVRDGWLREKIK